MIRYVYSLWPNDYSQPPDICLIPSYNRALPIVCNVVYVSNLQYMITNEPDSFRKGMIIKTSSFKFNIKLFS